MKKTKIFLLAGVVLPAFAIAAPSLAAPLASDGSIVVAQSDDGDKQQRREERQQQKQERQEQKQERQQSREDRPAREDRPSREERQQSQDRSSREERQQQKQERQQAQPTTQNSDDRPKAREDRPSREERQQQKQERQQNRDAGGDAAPSQNREPKADRNASPSDRDQDRSERRRERDDSGGRQSPSGANSDRPGASGNSDEGRGRLQQMREDRDRERSGRDADTPNRDQRGGGDRQNRPDDAGDRNNREKLEDLRDKRQEDRRDERREDRQERREDGRQKDRVDNLQDRIKDEKRENERKDDRIDRLKDERKETRDGNRIVITEPGGRRIIRDGDKVIIRRDENARFRFGINPRDIREERRGGEVRTVVTRPDGSRVITVTDEDGRLIRRVREYRGQEYVLIDNRPRGGRDGLFINLDIAPPRISVPRERYIVDADVASEDDISEAFDAPPVERLERSYSLDEIRQSAPLRQYVRSVDLDSVTFDTGSWYVRDDQIGKLDKVGQAMESAVKKNPRTVFMVEGHTDAVGSDNDNLSLSDRRAEAVAEVLTKYFDIPAENLTTQGYGEEYLKVQTDAPEERNRRVTVRNITSLLSAEK